MKIRHPRLLAGSLAIALVVGVGGGYVWAKITQDDDPAVDATLVEPGVENEPVASLGTVPDLEGDTLPDVSVSSEDGSVVSTASFVGEPLVINFWFSTCVPCAKELGEFAEIDAEFGDEVRFVGINPQDSVEVMERFAGERGVEYELFRDDAIEFQTALEIAFFPYTLFVAPDGTIVEQTGVLDADGLRQKVESLLDVST